MTQVLARAEGGTVSTAVATTTRESFAEHCKTHKIMPSQQVNLLIYYLALQRLVPEISLPKFLERAMQVAGATKENRAFPKDALDHHCPNKDSQWEPKERVDIMLLYLEVLEGLTAEGQWMSFDDFLASEALQYQAELSTPSVQADVEAGLPTVAEKKPRPKRARATAGPSAVPVVGAPAIYRMPLAGGVGPERPGTITRVYAGADGTVLVDFRTALGEDLPGLRAMDLQPGVLPPTLPPPAEPAPTTALVLPLDAANLAKVNELLAMTSPVPTTPLGDVLLTYSMEIGNGLLAFFNVINAQPKPCIDAYLTDTARNVVTEDLPPREGSILGVYTWPYNKANISVTIVPKQE